ncbi:MAG TPA: hypothetical protein VN328_00910 [Thermodesulfovibrionales bacterium]|nr:hypothetical protein [Thermodesulfovibrionales bacterium]
MKRGFLTGFAIILSLSTAAFAAPAPPEILINEVARECAKFYPGDECVSCVPPEGWISLPPGRAYQCPEGYKDVQVRGVCYPQRNSFCCTKGHSGAPGNCKDLVVNEKEKKCAFVDEIDKCPALPDGWQRPKQHVCPSWEYQWSGDLKCAKNREPRITAKEAEKIIWELPEVRLRAERIRKSGARPFTRIESEPEAEAKPGTEKAAFTIYFGEKHVTHTVREITFLVDAYTRKISVYDEVTDNIMPLEQWKGGE